MLDKAFAMIEAAAIKGERCPQNDVFPGKKGAVPELARQGRIKIEVFAHNWRVVTIMEGPNKGKRTKAAPMGSEPYKVIYKDHVRIPRRLIGYPGRER